MKNEQQKLPLVVISTALLAVLLLARTSATAADAGSSLPPLRPDAPRPWLYDGAIYAVHPYYLDGTFKAVTTKVPELASLGVKTIYLLPFFVSVAEQPGLPEERRYRSMYTIKDYYRIAPAYGTPEDLEELIATAHRHHLRVLFDLVLNHTQVGCVIYNKGWIHQMPLGELKRRAAKLGWPSKYGEKRDPRGGTLPLVTSEIQVQGRGDNRDTRRRYNVYAIVEDHMAKLHHAGRSEWGIAVDYTHPDLIEYVTKLAVYYTREFDMDGWRLDAPGNNWNPALLEGDHSMLKLLRAMRAAMVQVKPDIVLVSESERPERRAPTLFDEVCEASYDHDYFFQVLRLIPDVASRLAGDRSLPQIIRERRGNLLEALSEEEILHDRTRLRTLSIPGVAVRARIGAMAPEMSRPIAAFLFTIRGIPFIVAGDELGATRPFRAVDPNKDYRDNAMWRFLQAVLKIRNNSHAMKFGSVEDVLKSAHGPSTYAYLRRLNEEKIVVTVNFSNRAAENVLNVPWEAKTVLCDGLSGETFLVEQPDAFRVTVPAYGARILMPEKP